MKKWIGPRIILILVGIFVFSYGTKESVPQKTEPAMDATGKRTMVATDFSLSTLDGPDMSLKSTRGKKVILNFWATWCEPCRSEMPHMQAFYTNHQDEFEILAVNLTHKDNSIEKITSFVKNMQLTFPVLLDEEGDISTRYGAFTVPTTFILNEQGEILHEIGPMDEAFLDKLLVEE